MADNIAFDFSNIIALAADLGKVPDEAAPFVIKALEVTARNVKESWKEPLKGSARLRGGDRTISYDLKGKATRNSSTVTAEIGPALGGVGALVGMLEFGTPSTSPTGYGARALQVNEQDFQTGLEKALADGERAAGL